MAAPNTTRKQVTSSGGIMSSQKWTRKHIQDVMQEVYEGKTYSQIAKILGSKWRKKLTRNIIAGIHFREVCNIAKMKAGMK